MITEEDVKKIATITDDVIGKVIGKDIKSIKTLLERVDGVVDEQNNRIVEQNNILTGIMEVVEEQQHKISHLEEEVKKLKKVIQS